MHTENTARTKEALMFRRFLNISLIISLTFSVALAQQAATPPAPSVNRLREHVTYLASDKLDGRRTGSKGAELAAEYIAREFARYGLRRSNGYDTPGMSYLEADSPKRYMQGFPFVAAVELGKNNELRFSPSDNASRRQFRVGDDWMPLGLSSNQTVEANAVFAGYGITSVEPKYDDYAATDAKNKVAIVFAGTPDGENPHGQFARFSEVRFKVAAARAAGARALVIIAGENNLKEDRLSRLRYDNAGAADIPVLIASRQTAVEMLGGSVTDLSVFEKVADSRGISSSTAGDYSVARRLRQPTLHTINVSVDVVRREVPAHNVIGILPGSDPQLKNEAIVIGAHYDHLGRGGAGSLAPKEGEIHHGADDNASGAAGVLELARLFTTQDPRPRRTIVFIAFSGEEEGLLGSNYYVNHPVVPMANTVAMINMDMIGRLKNKNLIVGGVGTATEWRSMLESANFLQSVIVTATAASRSITPMGIPMVVSANGSTIVTSDPSKQFQLTLNEDGFGPSDHSSFYAKQIPVLFFWTGTHEDYHKPSDTADKINYEDESRILVLAAHVIRDIDTTNKRPTYTLAKTASTGRSTGFRVYLGTIPNYADSNDGLLLDGVREDSPAAKAGLKAGDRIVKLAGRDIRHVYDYTYALGEMKAGQEYEVEVMRGSGRLTLKLTPAERR
ncbi:MAG: M20/M25/M40 family metallo-hydrolase [Acidobacteriota bacterium]